MLESQDIKAVPILQNPKSNGISKRDHLTMGNMLHTMIFSASDWFLDMQRAFDAIAWATCTSINPNIKYLPCHFSFNQDMIFCCDVKIDWNTIHQLASSNQKEKQSCLTKQLPSGDKILIFLGSDSVFCLKFSLFFFIEYVTSLLLIWDKIFGFNTPLQVI